MAKAQKERVRKDYFGATPKPTRETRAAAHDPLPWANPANIAFNKKTKSLLVTNHASLTGLPDPSFLFAIFDVYVKDKAEKLFKDDDDD